MGDVVILREAAAAAAATAGAKEGLDVEVGAADVVVAVAVVAITTPACLEVGVPHGCDEETKTTAGATKPGGKRGCAP